MKIIFFGSDDFAQAHLEEILKQDFEVCACVTQPDKPKGRGMALTVSPIKKTAEEHGIPVLQPESLKDPAFLEELASFGADIFVVIAYGKFLPETLLDIPAKGALNVHGSLLPKYRGAAPIHWAVLNGEKETGVTVMFLNTEMDAGDIIRQARLSIAPEDTAVTLRQKMIALGKRTLIEVLKDFRSGEVRATAQNKDKVSYAPRLTKDLGEIDWHKSAEAICNQVRGLLPWPGAFTHVQGKPLKILAAEPVLGQGKPGEILQTGPETMDVAAGEGIVRIQQVHFAGGKPMSAGAFLRGHRLSPGEAFPL